MEAKDLYYHGIAKDCSNCFYRVKWPARWFTLSKCNKHPAWLTEDALKTCQYNEWQPKEELYRRYGEK
jgi:hypothetical protein